MSCDDDAEVGNRELGVLECSLRWALLLELPVTLDVDGGAVGPKLRHHPVVLLSQIRALAAQRALGFPPVLGRPWHRRRLLPSVTAVNIREVRAWGWLLSE